MQYHLLVTTAATHEYEKRSPLTYQQCNHLQERCWSNLDSAILDLCLILIFLHHKGAPTSTFFAYSNSPTSPYTMLSRQQKTMSQVTVLDLVWLDFQLLTTDQESQLHWEQFIWLKFSDLNHGWSHLSLHQWCCMQGIMSIFCERPNLAFCQWYSISLLRQPSLRHLMRTSIGNDWLQQLMKQAQFHLFLDLLPILNLLFLLLYFSIFKEIKFPNHLLTLALSESHLLLFYRTQQHFAF